MPCPCPQTRQVGIQADSGEEGQHQWVFQRHIKADFPVHRFLQNQEQDRHQ